MSGFQEENPAFAEIFSVFSPLSAVHVLQHLIHIPAAIDDAEKPDRLSFFIRTVVQQIIAHDLFPNDLSWQECIGDQCPALRETHTVSMQWPMSSISFAAAFALSSSFPI